MRSGPSIGFPPKLRHPHPSAGWGTYPPIQGDYKAFTGYGSDFAADCGLPTSRHIYSELDVFPAEIIVTVLPSPEASEPPAGVLLSTHIYSKLDEVRPHNAMIN